MPRRAAIYARYSTDLQHDRSIDDQFALCQAHASREALTVVATFADRAKTSDSLIGRDGIMDAIEAARAGAFDTLIVESLDRISRDQEDLAHVFKRLDFAGVAILTAHEGQVDALAVGIRGLVGAIFLKDLKQKVRRGMSGVVRDGRHAGGRAYGYCPVPGKPGELQIVEHEAEIVRRIFTAYIAGKSPRTIAGELNAEGVPPPRGSTWNASTINGNRARGYGILRNPLYRGEVIWNRVRMIRDPETGKRVSRVNPESEWQHANAPELAVISEEMFAAAESRADRQTAKRAAGTSTKRMRRPFSGRLVCGVCGGKMAISSTTKTAVRVACSRAKESRTCHHRASARLDKIEAAVFDQLRSQLREPTYLAEFVRAYREERRRLSIEASRARGEIERRAKRASAEFDRLTTLYARGVLDGPEAEARIRKALDASRDAAAELTACDQKPDVVELHPQAVEAYSQALDDLSDGLAAYDVDDTTIDALHAVISHLVVHPKDAAGRWPVEVHGSLSALIEGDPLQGWVVVVAEEGLEPPTRGL